MMSNGDLLSRTSPIGNVSAHACRGSINPGNCVFSVTLHIPCLENETARREIIFAHST